LGERRIAFGHGYTADEGGAGHSEEGLKRLCEQVANLTLALSHVYVKALRIVDAGSEQKAADLWAIPVHHEQPCGAA
jgi:hypothetical protein